MYAAVDAELQEILGADVLAGGTTACVAVIWCVSGWVGGG
jgi:hypothetical protein